MNATDLPSEVGTVYPRSGTGAHCSYRGGAQRADATGDGSVCGGGVIP